MSITICYAVIFLLEACILLQYCRNLFTAGRSACISAHHTGSWLFYLISGFFS